MGGGKSWRIFCLGKSWCCGANPGDVSPAAPLGGTWGANAPAELLEIPFGVQHNFKYFNFIYFNLQDAQAEP